MNELVAELLKHGITGVALAAMGWYILKQARIIASLMNVVKEVQDKRIADAQMVTDRVIGLTDKWHSIVSEFKAGIENQSRISEDTQEMITRLLERNRRS